MHWKHSRYQIVFQILANCHTYDEGYRVLCELEEDRMFSIESSVAESYRAQAKIVGARSELARQEVDEMDRLKARAFESETIARHRIAQPCLDAALEETAFIRFLKARINPLRKYADRPDMVAHQLCQVQEHKLDLAWKAACHILSCGMLPTENLLLIGMHPESEDIRKAIDCFVKELGQNNTLRRIDKDQFFSSYIGGESVSYLPRSELASWYSDSFEQNILEYAPSDRELLERKEETPDGLS